LGGLIDAIVRALTKFSDLSTKGTSAMITHIVNISHKYAKSVNNHPEIKPQKPQILKMEVGMSV
jgi:hypothetical protein